MTDSKPEQTPVNDSGTADSSDTGLTRASSRSVPEPSATNVLKRLRDRHGFDSRVGRRCSNILEIMDGMTRPPEEWIDYLMPDWVPIKYAANVDSIARQTADLHRLLAA